MYLQSFTKIKKLNNQKKKKINDIRENDSILWHYGSEETNTPGVSKRNTDKLQAFKNMVLERRTEKVVS